ncbi:MAG: glycosyltransferase [Paludibacteraceae bacterium]
MIEVTDKIDVSIIIVNYNTGKLTKDCLNSVFQYTKGVNFEVIVVDNASTDDSIRMIRNEFKYVQLIESNENIGFGRANNIGFETAKGNICFC